MPDTDTNDYMFLLQTLLLRRTRSKLSGPNGHSLEGRLMVNIIRSRIVRVYVQLACKHVKTRRLLSAHLFDKLLDRPLRQYRYAVHGLRPCRVVVQHHQHSPNGLRISSDFVAKVMRVYRRQRGYELSPRARETEDRQRWLLVGESTT